MTDLFRQFSRQVKKLLPELIKIHVGILIFFVLVIAIRIYTKIPIPFLTRDPVSLLHGPYYYGYLSKIGILIWCAAAAICFFGFFMLRKLKHEKEYAYFLLASGVITLMLLVDDFFLLHENMLNSIIRNSEALFYGLYAVIMLLYLFRFRNSIIQTDFVYMMLALLFFGISVIFDVLQEFDITLKHGHYILEDGTKLIGMFHWLIYFWREIHAGIKKNIHPG